MNKQPYYNEVQVLFTTTSVVPSEELVSAIHQKVEEILRQHEEEVVGELEVYHDFVPGDPADLM